MVWDVNDEEFDSLTTRTRSPSRPSSVHTKGSMVEVRGFEPLTPAVRRQCSTGLSYTPVLG
jgi:hypothetical protein